MRPSLRHARRAVLAAAALAAGALAQPYASPATDAAAHADAQAFLARLAAYPAAVAARADAMAATEAALPAPLRATIAAGGQAASASPRDYLAFCAMEALPLPAEALLPYVPRSLVFVVPQRQGQGAVAGAAWLPGIAEVEWQVAEGAAGLAFAGRPGWLIGAGSGLVAAVVAGPEAAYVGPGVPPLLANRQALQQGRSGSGAAAALAELTACRVAQHVIYDAVEATLTVATSGSAWNTDSPGGICLVLGPGGGEAAANATALRRSLEANHGWLTAAKAQALLRAAVPGADSLVLDVDAGTGVLSIGGVEQALTV